MFTFNLLAHLFILQQNDKQKVQTTKLKEPSTKDIRRIKAINFKLILDATIVLRKWGFILSGKDWKFNEFWSEILLIFEVFFINFDFLFLQCFLQKVICRYYYLKIIDIENNNELKK